MPPIRLLEVAHLIGLLLAPEAHEAFEIRIAAGWQDDPQARIEIGRAVQALALEPKGFGRIDTGRQRDLDVALEGGDAHLAAQHGLVKRYRNLDAEIGAVAAELPVAFELDRDDGVARLPADGGGHALALETDLL